MGELPHLLKKVGKAAALTEGHLDEQVLVLLPGAVVGDNVGVLWERGDSRHLVHAPVWNRVISPIVTQDMVASLRHYRESSL